MRIHGVVTDFGNQPLADATVRIDGREFAAEIASTHTDHGGHYEIEVPAGPYLHIWICKNCGVEYLEYWAWNVLLNADLELNARVGGIEIYALNAFWFQRATANRMILFFRPMALKRCLAFEAAGRPMHGLIDICPPLSKGDITVTLDAEPLTVLRVNQIVEHGDSDDSYLHAYLVQVAGKEHPVKDAVRKVHVAVIDRETGEQGEGSFFWRPTIHHRAAVQKPLISKA